MQKTKEELLLRAINSAGHADFIKEDLSDLITFLTPKDTPMYRMLKRKPAYQFLHEWTERSLGAVGTGAAYDGESALPSENTNNGGRRFNKVMQLGRIARVTEFVQAQSTVGKGQGLDPMALEMEEKIQNLMRDIEYFIWNGDIAQTAPQQMDGIIKLSSGFQTVSNGGSAAALQQLKLDEALAKAYESGGNPTVIACRPLVAQRIANFTVDKIRYAPQAGPQGVSDGAFTYISPFGYTVKVVPVRGDFLPSGSVYILDESLMWLCPMDGVDLRVKDLPIQGDDVARKLIKSYLTLEVRGLTKHAKITGVADAL